MTSFLYHVTPGRGEPLAVQLIRTEAPASDKVNADGGLEEKTGGSGKNEYRLIITLYLPKTTQRLL